MQDFLLSLDVSRGKFKPLVWYHHTMDQLVATAKDCGYRSNWVDLIHIEEHLDPQKDKMVGFKLVSINYLLEKGETSSSLRLTMRAMISDLENRENWTRISKKELVNIYARAILLLLRHPTMWKFKK